jgi:hypothetical protein
VSLLCNCTESISPKFNWSQSDSISILVRPHQTPTHLLNNSTIMHYVTNTPVQATLPSYSTLVLLIDPISTSCRIAQEISKRGHHLCALWTKDYIGDSAEQQSKRSPGTYGCGGLRYKAELEEGRDYVVGDGDVSSLVDVVQEVASTAKLSIVGCFSGSGLSRATRLADGLAVKLGLEPCLVPPKCVGNDGGVGGIVPDICNKNTQQELLKAAGLRCIRQVCSSTLDESTVHFLETEKYPLVVKPASKDRASGGIKLCRTKEEAVDHFNLLIGANQSNGSKMEVICQEYLRGTEVVVDHVSRNFQHKTCMVWKYDKRPANGENHVYFGMIPVESDSYEAELAIPYVRKVLDALGCKNGPSHAECIITTDGRGAVLVEMNVRAQGGDGSWSRLATALTGRYSQIEASVDAWLDEDEFDSLPDAPLSPFQSHGLQVHFVSYSEGEVVSTPGFEVLKHLPSFVSLSPSVGIGSTVEYTTDLATSPGVCLLMNKDENKLKKDLDFLRYMEEINGLFTYKTNVESLARPTAASYGTPHRRIKSTVDRMEKPSLLRILSNDRPELARQGMLMKRMTTVDSSKEVVIVTDPYSTGCLLVNEMCSRGYRVIGKIVILSCGGRFHQVQRLTLSCLVGVSALDDWIFRRDEVSHSSRCRRNEVSR